jgi:release factor glutamine methyltransferase
LKAGGWCGLEIGYDQRGAVEALLRVAGFEAIETRRDLGDRDRVVIGRKPNKAVADGRGVAET